MEHFEDYYAILGVPRFYATQDEIRSAYLKQVKFFHPDANNVPPEIAQQKTQHLNNIYDVLKNPKTKRIYDDRFSAFLKNCIELEKECIKEEYEGQLNQKECEFKSAIEQADEAVKKADICARKYQKSSKVSKIIIVCFLLISCVISYLYINETNKTKDYDELQARFHNIYESNQNLRSKLSNMEDEYEFYHNYAVIVTESGTKYHRYGCYHIENKSFYIYNIENAKSHGYTACKDCFGMV